MKQQNYSDTWDMKTLVENHVYEDIDFTGTDFNHPIFKNVDFKNCIFAQCNLDDARTYSCNFTNCKFEGVDLRGVLLGAHGGKFTNCIFKRCNFKKRIFDIPDFINCLFDHCQLRGWEPNGSSFENCKIKGKIAEVTFYDYFKYPEGPERVNLFYSIDFSEAEFGEYVGFEQCDLSLSIPPNGYTFDELLTEELPSQKRFNVTQRNTGARIKT